MIHDALREQIDNLFQSYACGKVDQAIQARIISLIRAEMLEEAAKVVDDFVGWGPSWRKELAAAIRALKEGDAK
jgi:hypothetical protein